MLALHKLDHELDREKVEGRFTMIKEHIGVKLKLYMERKETSHGKILNVQKRIYSHREGRQSEGKGNSIVI